jgi:Ca-activated chloride channel family protein
MAGVAGSLLLLISLAYADGLLQVADSRQFLRLSRTLIDVQVYDQIALTTVTHEFINTVDADSVDVIYMFPLPEQAAVTGFAVWRDTAYVAFELAAADTGGGQQTYPGGGADPALMDYLLPNPFIVPTVATGDTFRVRLSYAELLPFDFGAIRYRFPLNSGNFSAGRLDALAFLATFSTQRTITSIQTPAYAAGIDQSGPYSATVGYDNANFTPASDFIIDFTLSQEEVGLFTLTYRDPSDSTETAGYFVLLLEPGNVQPGEILNKYFTFVLDRSGSMSGSKIEQAREAARFSVEHLNPNDFFNIVDFASQVTVYRNEPVIASPANIAEAVSYINAIQAGGGTNANQALLTALSLTVPDAVNQIIFLTDGLPTVGVTNTESILSNVQAANTNNASIFVFGVGNDVGKDFLQALADQNHGVATYIRWGEPIDDIIVNFFARISNPVLVDVGLDFGQMEVFDLYPVELPDLFAGFQLVVAGRNRDFGTTDITLTGRVASADTSIVYSGLVFPDSSTQNVFVPKIWAKKKIDHLYARWLKEGQPDSLKLEIIALSVKYGVLSPFTRFQAPQPPFTSVEGVLLARFEVAAVFDADRPWVRLRWRIEGEVADVSAIEVYRAEGGGTDYLRVATLPGDAHQFTDRAADPTRSYRYRLDLVLLNGERVSRSVVYTPRVAQLFHLAQNYPNPFSPDGNSILAGSQSTSIRFFLGQRSPVKLTVYNLRGEEVAVLVDRPLASGSHRVVWDGIDAQGRPVPSGVYLYRLSVPEFTQTRRLIVVR